MKLILWLLCLTVQLSPQHVKEAVDADTFSMYHVGVGYRGRPEEWVRVLNVDTPEKPNKPERREFATDSLFRAARLVYVADSTQWAVARRFTLNWLSRAPFTLHACLRDSFARLLAVITRGADTLAVALITAGLGVRDDR